MNCKGQRGPDPAARLRQVRRPGLQIRAGQAETRGGHREAAEEEGGGGGSSRRVRMQRRLTGQFISFSLLCTKTNQWKPAP